MKNEKYIIYATTWEPNGTNTILIVDQDLQIVDSLDEALFGVNVDGRDSLGNCTFGAYGEFIGLATYDADEAQGELTPDQVRSGETEFTEVMELELEYALGKVAVSPVSDGTETLQFLAKYFDLSDFELVQAAKGGAK